MLLTFSTMSASVAYADVTVDMAADTSAETAIANDSIANDSIANDTASALPLTESEAQEVTADDDRNWWRMLRKGQLDLKDTTVVYPKFIGFCVDVYNWGDWFFNSTDEEYIAGTGKRWKAFIKNDNWVDSYAMNLGYNMPIRIMSDMYCNLGAYIQYMAVSVGYSIDMSNVIGNKPSNHRKYEFGFSCARFNVRAYFNENTGGSYLRTFGDYRGGRLFKKEFPGVQLSTYGIDSYFIFNNRKYSYGAAYSFSRVQKKSAGSFILGFSYSNIDISIDLAQLPYPLNYYLSIPATLYRFHYDTYNLLVGYGYNWVFRRNWLFNITALPIIGLNHCREDSSERGTNQMAIGGKGSMSLVYNWTDIYLGLQGHIDGHWYRSRTHSFFSSIEDLAVVAGVRF